MERDPHRVDAAVNEATRELVALRKQIDSAVKALNVAAAGRVFTSAAMRRRNGGMKTLASRLRILVASEILESVETELDNVAADAKASYRPALERSLSSTGWEVMGEWPSYFIEHLVELKIDFRTERARVGRKTLANLEIEPIVATTRAELIQLRRHPFDPETFFSAVESCYEGSQRGRQYLSVARLASCLRESQGRSYSVARLALDLSRLLDALPQASARLDFSPSRSPQGALHLRSRAWSGFVSGIRLRDEDEVT